MAEERGTTSHLSRPNVPHEPPNVTHSASDQVPSGCLPGAVKDPREGDECDGEVRCGDGDHAKERYWCGGMTPAPDVYWDECEWGGEEGEVEERGEGEEHDGGEEEQPEVF